MASFRNLIALVGDAMEQPRHERDALLVARCGDDGTLLAEARSLLALDERESATGITEAVWERMLASANRTAASYVHPTRIGPYLVVSVLGEGGMGVVYRARQEEPIRRDVAVKVLRSGLATPRAMARFELERQTLARLDHPGIARVYDAGATDEGLPYLAMECVHGETITSYCQHHSLGLDARLSLFRQVCLAVHHAHQKAVIHRDLKPGNILVSQVDGVALPKVIDFGIARIIDDDSDAALTMQGSRIGTVEYMSPEQALPDGTDVDVRSDIYSLGVVLYELLTGSLPFVAAELRRAGPVEMRRLMLDTDPPTPSQRQSVSSESTGQAPSLALRPDVDWVVMTALDKDPARRYQSADALALDLLRLVRNQPVAVAAPGVRYRITQLARRRRTAVTAAAAVLLALVAGVTISTIGLVRARQAQQVAETETRKATAVTRFLTEMFASAEPDRALGNVVTVRSVLEAAAIQLDSSPTGTGDPAVDATIRFTLANSYRALGEYSRAIPLYRRALAVWRTRLPESDERIARSLHGLGNSYWRMSELDSALTYARQVLALRERTIPRGDPRYSEAVEVLGSAYSDLGQTMLADSLYRVAVAIDSAVLEGPARVQLATSLNNLATVLMDQRRYEEAADALRESLGIRLQYLSPDAPQVATTLGNLGEALMEQGSLVAALDTIHRAVALAERIQGPDHIQTASNKFKLGRAYLRSGYFDSATAALQDVRQVRAATSGELNWSVADTDIELGTVAVRRGNVAAGLDNMQRGWQAILDKLGPDHSRVRERAAQIAAILQDTDTAAAAVWRQRALGSSET